MIFIKVKEDFTPYSPVKTTNHHEPFITKIKSKKKTAWKPFSLFAK